MAGRAASDALFLAGEAAYCTSLVLDTQRFSKADQSSQWSHD